MFRVIQVFFGVPESYGNLLGEVVGLNGPYGKGEKGPKGWPCTPPPSMASMNWTREGAAPPSLSFFLSYSFPLSPLGKGRGLQLGS